MPTPVQAGACGPDTKKVDFGTKFMSDVMRSASTVPWADGIIKADRAQIQNAHLLNPANRNRNTYGFLLQGISASNANWQAADPENHKVMEGWITQLNKDFNGVQSYKPGDLPKIAKNLDAAADRIAANAECLAQQVEISPRDAGYFKNLAGAMKSAAKNLRALHEAVCKGPDIEVVTLDIPARQH